MKKAKKKRIGRPPLPEGAAKAVMFTVRMMPDEREAIARAAERAGVSVSQWVRRALLEAARRS